MDSYTYQPLISLAGLLADKGIREVILSPGSRCAPLTLGVAREPRLNARTISDERSAGFIALGLAITRQEPVVLICTSGTAALNYAPAVTEAFYQQVPLIVLTADRPPEWIDQQDGQSIRQYQLFGRHVKESYQTPASLGHPAEQWHLNRIINEAINLSRTYPAGPVHVNIPIREPFYPSTSEAIAKPDGGRVIREASSVAYLTKTALTEYAQAWRGAGRILVIAGQVPAHPAALPEVLGRLQVPVLTDITSNLHQLPSAVALTDSLLAHPSASAMQPDLVISFGLSVLSKNLKNFLRKNPPKNHWHIQPAGAVADPYQCLTDVIRMQPEVFFQQLFAEAGPAADTGWLNAWLQADSIMAERVKRFFQAPEFSEFAAVHHLMQHSGLRGCYLHLANSMSVRYANYVGAKIALPARIFCNRGTSGIDGCVSTAIGSALATPAQQHFLITGDLAFFYDRNGLWHTYLPDNLKILLLNNYGGVIFRLIDGPGNLPELETYFETKQTLEASAMACQHGIPYFRAEDQRTFLKAFDLWLQSPGMALLEVNSMNEKNKKVFDAFKKALASE